MTQRKMAIALTTSVRILLVGIAYSELAVHYACTYNVSDVNNFPMQWGLTLALHFSLIMRDIMDVWQIQCNR